MHGLSLAMPRLCFNLHSYIASETCALCSADEVVVSVEGESLGDRVMEITGGKGAYAAIECIGGDIFAQASGWGVVGVRWGGRRDSCR